MRVYRLCRAKFTSLDGEGSRLYGGRWNSAGRSVVYASSTLALAALESLVHFPPTLAPTDLIALTIEIPEDLKQEEVATSRLPSDWYAHIDSRECRLLGDAWLTSAMCAVLQVPAAPVPQENNYLINPLHLDASRIVVVATQPFRFDPRLVK